jgi:single-strand DNA-binding protein
MSINKIILVGNVGKDPEIRKTKDGKDIANFSLATTENWKDKTGERMSKTQWHNVVVFNDGLAGVIKNYVKKGSKLYVEGSSETREWTDKNGNKRYSTEVIVKGFGDKIEMLDKKEGGIDSHSKAKGDAYVEEEEFLDDEIVF